MPGNVQTGLQEHSGSPRGDPLARIEAALRQRKNQNLSGRRNTVESKHGARGIPSAKIVPNTGFG